MVTREEARASGMASPSPTTALLARVRAFCFPNGEESARGVRAIEATERGEMRSSARSKWLAFTAEETIEACRSGLHGGCCRPTAVLSSDHFDAAGAAFCSSEFVRLDYPAAHAAASRGFRLPDDS